MAGISQLWDQLVDCICRPPRDEYEVRDLPGGTSGSFAVGRYAAQRRDFQLTNKRGRKLEVSRFMLVPVNPADATEPVPTVIYCHCNSGSRRDAEEAIYRLLPEGIALVCCDFEGSGLSEGSHVTLGAHEVDDVQTVLEHLRENNLATTIGLWGRSMGAVTALLCSQRDPSIAGIVCDSPFSKLTELMVELVEEQKLPIPKYLMKLAISFMRRSVRKRAGFDILDVAPIDKVGEAFVPALFGHADGDNFILKQHSEVLHQKYAGEKNFISFDGDHNSIRPTFFYTSVVIFFHNVLRIDVLPDDKKYRRVQNRVNLTGVRLDERVQGVDSSLQPAEGLKADDSDIRGRDSLSPPLLEGVLSRMPDDGLFSPTHAMYEQSAWWESAPADSGANEGEYDYNKVLQQVLEMSLREMHASNAGEEAEGSGLTRVTCVDACEPSTEAPLHGENSYSLLPKDDMTEQQMLAKAIAQSLAVNEAALQGESPSSSCNRSQLQTVLDPTVRVVENGANYFTGSPRPATAPVQTATSAGWYINDGSCTPNADMYAESEPSLSGTNKHELNPPDISKSCVDLLESRDRGWRTDGEPAVIPKLTSCATTEEEELEQLRQKAATSIAWPTPTTSDSGQQ